MTPPHGGRAEDRDEPPVTVRDRRRIDPETGELREPQGDQATGQDAAAAGAGEQPAPTGGESPADAAAAAQVAQLTDQLQRIAAEYANYRRRTERTLSQEGQRATGVVAQALLPVLDDIGRAREHGDLSGAFKAVGEAVEQTLEKLGLVRDLPVGEPFDPNRHEALLQQETPEVSEPTVGLVLRPGYSIGDRLLRPAQVQVALPADEPGGTGGALDGEG